MISISNNLSFVFFLLRNYDTEIYAFSKRLGEEFNNDLLQQALTERSYIIREEERQKNVGIDQPTLNLSDNKELVSKGSDFIDDVVKRYLRTVLPRLPEEGIMYVYSKSISVILPVLNSLINIVTLLFQRNSQVFNKY